MASDLERFRERLKEIYVYDPETGTWRWRIRANQSVRAGDIAGNVQTGGYRQLRVDGRHYLAHRLAFVWVLGRWPYKNVDHVNMDRSDNRWVNLRDADRSQNGGNRRAYKSNVLGVKGVTKRKSGKYHVQIQINKKKIHFGSYDSLDVAKSIYAEAAKKAFLEYHRTE